MPKTLEELITAARTDTEFQQQLRNAANSQEVVHVAAARGLTVTTSEVEQLLASLQDRPVSEEELDGVAGGIPGGGASILTYTGCTH